MGIFASLHVQRSWFILLYEPAYRCCLMFSVALFLHNHWKFACQYLKTALLFKHAFVKNITIKALEELTANQNVQNARASLPKPAEKGRI